MEHIAVELLMRWIRCYERTPLRVL